MTRVQERGFRYLATPIRSVTCFDASYSEPKPSTATCSARTAF